MFDGKVDGIGKGIDGLDPDVEAPKVNKLLASQSFRKEVDKGFKFLGEAPSIPGSIPPPSSPTTK